MPAVMPPCFPRLPAGRRREALQRAVLFHVLLTSYEMLNLEAAELGRLEWGGLVIDEGHRLRNKEVCPVWVGGDGRGGAGWGGWCRRMQACSSAACLSADLSSALKLLPDLAC
jgi:hypothetical protein